MDAAFGKAHVPGWLDGSGAYSLDTLGCFSVCEAAIPDVLAAVASVSAAIPVGSALVACDYGAADGGTSLPLWNQVADAVDVSRELHLFYEDQATNDWKSVFAHVDGRLTIPVLPGNTLPLLTPLAARPNVFIAAVGTSFHRQCLPSGSLHLGFSATAMHWLSRKPCDMPALHHTLCNPAGCAAATAFAAQAAVDWESTLEARAKELAPGGRLVIANFAVDGAGQCLGNTSATGGPSVAMYAALYAAWTSLVADGRITAAETARATFINYYRTQAETVAPFAPGGAATAAGLRLLDSRMHVTRCPFRAAWLAHRGDAVAHAAAFVKTVRTWSESTFSTALDESRSGVDRKAVVEELFRRYAATVAAAPAEHGMDYVHCYLNVERVVPAVAIEQPQGEEVKNGRANSVDSGYSRDGAGTEPSAGSDAVSSSLSPSAAAAQHGTAAGGSTLALQSGRGLPGVRDCAHPHVTVVRHELGAPGNGDALFVATEALSAGVAGSDAGGTGSKSRSDSDCSGDSNSTPCTPTDSINAEPGPLSESSPFRKRQAIASALDEDDPALSSGCSDRGSKSSRSLAATFGGTPVFPGNGGTRVLSYVSEEAAAKECAALAAGMGYKHRCYNTGFSGAKLVARVTSVRPAELPREVLVGAVAGALNDAQGSLYTGCDLNTSLEDMRALDAASPYVLAGLDACVDPNVATAYGLAGAVAALAHSLRAGAGLAGCTVFVQGCGKVGSCVAKLLMAAGATVLVSDVVPGLVHKAVPGAVDVSALPWTDVDADIFVPCAASGVITLQAAACMRVRGVCGSANVPFTTEEALRAAAQRGVVIVPEAVSSAGAVIADSLEFFDPDTFFALRNPAPVYSFIRALCSNKCSQLLAEAQARGCIPAEVLALVDEPTSSPPAGVRFRSWRQAATRTVDYVVVGAGVVGAACASVLAGEDRASVEMVEQSACVANPLGSSCGDSRMYRQMQSDAFYTQLQQATLPLWRDLEAAAENEEKTQLMGDSKSGSGSGRLLTPHGLLFWGEATEETVEGSIPGAAATMRAMGVPHEALCAEAMAARFPALAPYAVDAGLLEPGAGSVAATAAVQALVSRALSAGATLRHGVRVEAVALVRSRYGSRCTELVLSDGTLLRASKQVVYAAGAWTPELLRNVTGVELPVDIHSVAWGHYEVLDDMPDTALPQWFAFRGATHTRAPELEGCHGLYYGFPPIPAQAGSRARTRRVAKVGVDYTPSDARHRPTSMAAFDYSPSAVVAADMDAFVASHMPGLGARVDLQCSPYSMSPDGDFVLGRVPGVPDASCFTGGSGRAFKFAPLLGACLADVAAGRPTRFNLQGRFDPARFSKLRKAVNPGSC